MGAGVWRVLMPFPAMTKGKCVAAAAGGCNFFWGGRRVQPIGAVNSRFCDGLCSWKPRSFCCIWARVVPPKVEQEVTVAAVAIVCCTGTPHELDQSNRSHEPRPLQGAVRLQPHIHRSPITSTTLPIVLGFCTKIPTNIQPP